MRRNIFIASSAELKTERLELVDLLLDSNNDTKNVGIQFKPVVWEFMDSSMQEGRKEDEYLVRLKECEICLVLFWKTLGNTFLFSILLVPLNLILSLLLALYLGEQLFGSRYVRTVIFLPVVTSGVAWAIVWKYLLQSGTAGPVNYFLSLVGITGPNWLTDKNWAMISVVVNRVLKNLGTNVLIFLGAVMNMPKDVIEAARMDGMPTILMVTIVTMIGSMRVFDTIRLMTDGGPEGSTMVLVYYIYHQAFKMFNTGYASAIAVILFMIVLILTIIQWTLRKKVSHYED